MDKGVAAVALCCLPDEKARSASAVGLDRQVIWSLYRRAGESHEVQPFSTNGARPRGRTLRRGSAARYLQLLAPIWASTRVRRTFAQVAYGRHRGQDSAGQAAKNGGSQRQSGTNRLVSLLLE